MGRLTGLRWWLAGALVGCTFRAQQAVPDGARDAAHDAAHALDAADGGILASGLVAYYRMESIAGSAAIDASGNGHDATCTGCPSVGSGQVGSGYHFDGTDRVDADGSAFELTSGLTVATWVRFETLPNDGTFHCPAGKVFGTGITNSWQICFDPNADQFVFVTSPDGTTIAEVHATASIAAATWYHVALTWDGSAQGLWVDGAQLGSAAGVKIAYDAHPMTFGGDIDNGQLSATIAGDLDELRIYDHALGSADLAILAGQ